MTTFRHYRGPIVTAGVFWVASCAWGALRWGDESQAHRDLLVRPVVVLSSTVAMLLDRVAPGDGSTLDSVRHLFRDRLELRPPLTFAILVRGQEHIATAGTVPPGIVLPDRRDDREEGDLRIYRMPVGWIEEAPDDRGPRAEPPDARPPPPGTLPFRWRPAAPEGAVGPPSDRFDLIVGADARLPQFRFRKQAADLARILLVGWIGIGALTFAWVVSIRRRLLAEDLAVERQRRAHLEDLGLAAAGLAHETKNPLGIILGLADRIHRDPASGNDTRTMAEQIMDAADRAAARVGEFLTFARVPTPRLAAVPAKDAIRDVAAALESDFLAAGVRLEVHGEPVAVRCDREMLGQVLVNLLLNSLQASPAETTVTVRLERQKATALIAVEDQGRGIPPGIRADIFKPYVTGRPAGHGLGLTIVQRIADQHGWTISVAGEPGQGTRVTIAGIPLAAGEAGTA
jgi:signal transduction histidine kinase